MYQALKSLLDEELAGPEPALAEAETGSKATPSSSKMQTSRSKTTGGRVASKSSRGRSPKQLATAARR